MLIAMVVIFIGCWLPLDLFKFFAPHLEKYHVDVELYLFLACHVLAMSSVTYNPFLYGWLNENFHKHFLASLRCLKSKQCIAEELTQLETFQKNSVDEDEEQVVKRPSVQTESQMPLINNNRVSPNRNLGTQSTSDTALDNVNLIVKT